jgi:hypothetical protein
MIQNGVMLLVVCGFLLAAGCSGIAPPQPPAPATLERLMLAPADMPANCTLAESVERTTDDVSSLAKDLGWQGGHVVRYRCSFDNTGPVTAIVHSVAIYPEVNMPDIVTLAERQDRSVRDLVFTDLPDPGLGLNGRAFQATLPDGMPAPAGADTGTGKPVKAEDRIAEPFIEIIFSKGSAFEVLTMTGPGADYRIIHQLAQTAYARIP